jgi:hypothetical protein
MQLIENKYQRELNVLRQMASSAAAAGKKRRDNKAALWTRTVKEVRATGSNSAICEMLNGTSPTTHLPSSIPVRVAVSLRYGVASALPDLHGHVCHTFHDAS